MIEAVAMPPQHRVARIIANKAGVIASLVHHRYFPVLSPSAARRALALIWTAIDRLQEFPDLGIPTEDADIRQIVIGFGAPATSCAMPSFPRMETS